MLVDLEDQKILSEFHQYIIPIESPTLSEFCVNFTGITQQTIDNDAIPLQTGLLKFNQWLTESIEKYEFTLPKTGDEHSTPATCAFVTWSDWDFGVCLKKECDRKGIKKSHHFDRWVDLKATFKVEVCFRIFSTTFTEIVPSNAGLVQVQTEEFRRCNEIRWNGF